MNSGELKEIIYSVVDEYFVENKIKNKATGETVLFGSESVLDSLGFVNLIVEIENKLKDHDYDIIIASEKAMSRKNSPFRTINTLAEFIEEEIA